MSNFPNSCSPSLMYPCCVSATRGISNLQLSPEDGDALIEEQVSLSMNCGAASSPDAPTGDATCRRRAKPVPLLPDWCRSAWATKRHRYYSGVLLMYA